MPEHSNYSWGGEFTLIGQHSHVLLKHDCPQCCERFEEGQVCQTRYGPRGGTTFHVECAWAIQQEEKT